MRTGNEELLSATSVAKRYGGVCAVKDVSFSVHAGEVHALVGENGAGKSTLAKILSGSVIADAGTLRWRGRCIVFHNPAAAKAVGIEVIHQELELALPLTVAENIFLGALPSHWGLVNHKALHDRSSAILRQLGADLDPRAPVRTLRISDRQIVEIAKALVHKTRVLLMDEPTAALPPAEADRLLERIDLLRKSGVGIVYISHRLGEVSRIADRITVLRDGTKVAELRREEVDRPTLVSHILGRALQELVLERSSLPSKEQSEAAVVECSDLTVGAFLQSVSFCARKGEIVGFFGLLGAGQSTIAEALFGLHRDRARVAECRLGSLRALPAEPRAAIGAGVGYVPADRRGEGLALTLSVAENIVMPAWPAVTRCGGIVIDRNALLQLGKRIVGTYDVRCVSLDQPVGTLSGGNQQKVALGKWATRETRVLLLDEPTRGVDVGAKAEIYRLLKRFALSDGVCLIFSSDAEEISTVCDRAYVLARGHIAAELKGSNFDQASLTRAALAA